jgi:hypothetical protein
MPAHITPDTPATLTPVHWLLGRWEGAGVVGYPTIDEYRFGQEIEFWHDGRPFLHYRSQAWLLDDDGNQIKVSASETGFWRIITPQTEEEQVQAAKEQRGVDLEVLLTHPTGIVEIYTGLVKGNRIDLTTDVVARTQTAKEYTAAQRMYGMVEGDLLWVMDMAAVGQPMTAHASARLKKV